MCQKVGDRFGVVWDMLQYEWLPGEIQLDRDCPQQAWLKSIEILVKTLHKVTVAFQLVRLVKKDTYTEENIKEWFEIVGCIMYHQLPSTCHDKLCCHPQPCPLMLTSCWIVWFCKNSGMHHTMKRGCINCVSGVILHTGRTHGKDDIIFLGQVWD